MTNKKPENNLYLLSFIDVADRLDILLLEIRHLQQSIIHYLRAPTLYLPLRYEEEHLFGENWNDNFKKGSTISYDIQLVKNWIIRYPTPNKAIRIYSGEIDKPFSKKTNNLRSRIGYAVKKRVGQIWMGDNWARDQRAQYHALYALQLLKQRILRDKVALYRAAVETNLTSDSNNTQTLDRAAFMILRQAIIDNANRYVSILSNHKQQVSQSIDFGMPSDPRPSTERRREMGIFMDFLSNRTQDIHRDILHLLSFFEHNSVDDSDASGILMFHGWSQSARVTNFHLFDKTNYLFNKYRQGKKPKPKKHIGYVNTSFWTPDRPDLQPIIAHEIADSVNKNVLGRIDDVALSNRTDDFTQLLIQLKSILFKHANQNKHLSFLKEDGSKYIQQIASDLLAGSVKGVSYLYSLFLLRVGDSLGDQLNVSDATKLDMVYSLQEGTASFDDSLLSFLRLQLTAAWIEKVVHVRLSDLDTMVIAGVKKITDDILLFLDGNAPPTRAKRAKHWQNLSKEMINEIQKSKAVSNCSRWRQQRSADDWIEWCSKPGKKRFARSTRRLNVRLQNYLFRELLAQKKSIGKPLYGAPFNELKQRFNQVYPVTIEEVKIPYAKKPRSLQHPASLFRHMYDIPYQSAVIRSIDILHKRLAVDSFFKELRWDMELGRGLFSVALEFHARETESPEHRLALCINQVSYIYQQIDDPDLREALKKWLSLKNSKIIIDSNSPSKIKKSISRHKVYRLCKNISEINANEINKAFSFFRPIHARQIRRLEEVAGYKLRELLAILEKHMINIKGQAVYSQLCSLVQFLSIRRPLNIDDKAISKTQFYDHMLAAMGDISEKQKREYERGNQILKKHLPKRVPSVMIHRLSMTNYYPVPDPANLNSDVELAPDKNLNGMPLSECIQKNRWLVNYSTPENESSFSNTWIVLGRFDAISLIEVRLPCKCYLQGFMDNMRLPFKHSENKNNKLEQGKDEFEMKNISQKSINAQEDESFPPHFSRREIARPVTIIGSEGEAQQKTHEIMSHMHEHLFAMLSVTLQRRSMRLDFLYRLVRALNDDDLSKYHSQLEERILNLKACNILVLAYLTDGWGDVLFTFRKEGEMDEHDLNAIFQFQQAVYEDFMVDRTEIIFTPKCLDFALGKPEKYRVTIQTRMMEDRWLEPGIKNYKKNLTALCKNPPKDILSDVSVTLLPGRNDFCISFKGGQSTSPNKYEMIIKWLSDSINRSSPGENNAIKMLGHFETSIERVLVSEPKLR